VDDVTGLSGNLADGNELDTFITSDFLMFDFSPEAIKNMFEYMTPNKTMIKKLSFYRYDYHSVIFSPS